MKDIENLRRRGDDIKPGDLFGRWTVIERAPSRRQPSGSVLGQWRCRCECGTERVVPARRLRQGSSKSCGHDGMAAARAAQHRHGMSRVPEYRSWAAMMGRCYNRNHDGYPHYGMKGITVHPDWHDFKVFYREMGPRPGKDYSIERIDGTKGYFLNNCKWATKTEKSCNRSITRWLTFQDETLPAAQWARRFGVHPTMIYRKLDAGWSAEKVLTTLMERLAGGPPEGRAR